MREPHNYLNFPQPIQRSSLEQEFASLGFRSADMAFYLSSLLRTFPAEAVLLALTEMYLDARAASQSPAEGDFLRRCGERVESAIFTRRDGELEVRTEYRLRPAEPDDV